MVINPNLTPDAAGLQKNSAKASPRAASLDAATTQAQSPASAASMIFNAENLPPAGSEIQDSAGADQSLDFLQNSFLNQSSLVMSAQANQIPASVLQLLQP